ncbi:MAG TPA: TIM-barrel domain-containing protein [Bacteroidota bacterium]|nr:TIM-barrel domain-containing protein [Bacteroidota bacterium]
MPLSLHAQVSPGNVTSYERTGNTLTLLAGASTVRLSFYARDVVRVDVLVPSDSASGSDSSFAVIREPSSDFPVAVVESDSAIDVRSDALRVICRKSPFHLAFADSAGRPLASEPSSNGLVTGTGLNVARFTIRPGEHFYGTGERGRGLDLRGEAFTCYNTQTGGYATPLSTMNINVPFIASTGGYALFFDNTYKGRFDIGATDSTVLSYAAEGGRLTYYLIAGATLTRLIERYTWLTGRQPLPPRWAFGYIQSKNRYVNEEEARGIVHTMRTEGFPCDAIVLDLKWFRAMGDLAWDTSSWHDPEGMEKDFLREGFKTVLITEPYVVETSVNYAEASRLGFLARDRQGGTYTLDKWWSCGGCNASLFDMTNPAAGRWWWSKHPSFLGRYVAGLWTDLGEPERHPDDMIHYLGTAAKVHNIYDLLWAKTVFEGMNRFRPGERVFNLTRSGFAGIQRYGVITWSGDVSRSFGGLSVQLPMLLNMGLSGLAYHNSDIGGYARNPTTPELYIRWMEFGVFTPVTRAHGAGEVVNGAPTEPWRFGREAEDICREMLTLRYRLLPYNYSMAYRNYLTGLPLARPLVMMYPRDSAFADESSTYLWGDDMLVSPVVSAGERTKSVVFPEGGWVNYWTDEGVRGNRTVVEKAPLDRIPLFVRAGSIIPLAPPMRYSDERPLDTLTLCVYPGPAKPDPDVLYEDDGKTTAYQHGGFAVTTFTQSAEEANGEMHCTVGIGRSTGTFKGKIQRRTYIIEVHRLGTAPHEVRLNGRTLRETVAAIEGISPGSAYMYDPARPLLTVVALCSSDSAYTLSISCPATR